MVLPQILKPLKYKRKLQVVRKYLQNIYLRILPKIQELLNSVKKKKTTQCVTRANDLNTHFTEDARVAIYHTKRGLPISCHQKCRPMPQRDTHGPERLRANRLADGTQCNHFGNQLGGVLAGRTCVYPSTQQFHPWAFTPNK